MGLYPQSSEARAMPDDVCRHCGFAADVHASHCREFKMALSGWPSPAQSALAVAEADVFVAQGDYLGMPERSISDWLMCVLRVSFGGP